MEAITSSIMQDMFSAPEFDAKLKDAVSRVINGPSNDDPFFYTRQDIKRILHLSDATITRYTISGVLKAKKVGSRVLYPKESIDLALTDFQKRKYQRA